MSISEECTTVPFSRPQVKKTNKVILKKRWVPDKLHYYSYGHKLMERVTSKESDQRSSRCWRSCFWPK
jgi:hypothetical protein